MDKKLLEKYFLGKCNAQEEAKVVAWLETMKGDLYDLSSIEEAWYKFDVSEVDQSSWNSRILLQEIFNKIEQQPEQGRHVVLPQAVKETDNTTPISHKSNNWWLGKWVMAAAVSCLMVAGTFLWFDEQGEQEIASASTKPVMLTKSTTNGQRTTLKLSDGTMVKLNANSSITFPKSFAKGKRQVTLVGEAYFDVAHDSTRPFEVLAGDLTTTVLGTSFNVQAYPELQHASIALVSGKVCVHNTKKNDVDAMRNAVILAPSEALVYDKQQNQMKTQPLDEDLIAWKQGILVFKAASMEEMMETLEKWYGVEITYPQQKYSALQFTGRFDNKSLQHVMEGIQLTAGFKFELQGKKLSIK